MKVSPIRLVILGLIWVLYAIVVVMNYKYSPYVFVHYSSYQWLVSTPLSLLFFSVLFLLISRRVLFLLITGVLGWLVIYFAYFYIYNPFTKGKHNLYVHPEGLYQIAYPVSWEIKKLQSYVKVVSLKEPEGADDYYRIWNYANNSMYISYYFNKNDFMLKGASAFSGKYEGKDIVMMGNQKIEVFYKRGGVSDTSNSLAELRIPYKSGTAEGLFVIDICRDWNDRRIINPHAISPKRLLRKALPLVKTFKILAAHKRISRRFNGIGLGYASN